MTTFKHIALISFSAIALGLFSGCAVEGNSPQPSDARSTVYQSQTNSSRDFGYMYNRNNNLEYMDVKSIEKLKKAVAILIDKVDAMESKQNITQEVKMEVDKKTGAIHSEISALKQQIGSLNQVSSSNESTIRVNEPYSEDDMKILQFIEGKNR